mgnify:CR=1 FL=1
MWIFTLPEINSSLTSPFELSVTLIVGKPVYSYDYRTAVVDGYLVDHDAPHIIKTKLSEEGIVFEAGSTAPIYDPVTNTVLNSEELEDDLKFEVEDFNRKVVTKGFNPKVCAIFSKSEFLVNSFPAKIIFFSIYIIIARRAYIFNTKNF